MEKYEFYIFVVFPFWAIHTECTQFVSVYRSSMQECIIPIEDIDFFQKCKLYNFDVLFTQELQVVS